MCPSFLQKQQIQYSRKIYHPTVYSYNTFKGPKIWFIKFVIHKGALLKIVFFFKSQKLLKRNSNGSEEIQLYKSIKKC